MFRLNMITDFQVLKSKVLSQQLNIYINLLIKSKYLFIKYLKSNYKNMLQLKKIRRKIFLKFQIKNLD